MSENLSAIAAQAARERFEKWVTDMEPAYADENLERLTGGRGSYRVHNVHCWWMGWEHGREAALRVLEESRQPETQKLGYCDSPHNLDESMKQRSHQHNGLTCRYWHGQVEESRQPESHRQKVPMIDQANQSKKTTMLWARYTSEETPAKEYVHNGRDKQGTWK